MLRRLAVILQRLGAHRLLRRTYQRQVADFEEFRSCEKHHVDGIVVNRIAQTAFVDHQRFHSRAPRLDGASQPGGSCANADNVVSGHEIFSLPGVRTNCKFGWNYWLGGISRMSVSSRRKDSNSCRRSGVTGNSVFFHTKTSASPRFSLTLRLPATMYDGLASNFNPPLATGDNTAAHSPRLTHNALSYGGI